MKRQIAVLSFIILITACKDKKSNSDSNKIKQEATSNTAVQVSFEGELHTIAQKDLQPNLVKYTEKDIQYILWQDGNPVQINFNVKKNILEKGSGEYNIPEDNSLKIQADLNFFDQDRKVESKFNKRIVFRKGKIVINQLTKHKLDMTFSGEGSAMRERDKSFPISGKININF